MTGTQDSWPAGATWVFQGTIAEDATAGTHVCTLTVTPGAGNEIELLYGMVRVGNTATTQTTIVAIQDAAGGNNLVRLHSIADTAANVERVFPTLIADIANTANYGLIVSPIIISGTMSLLLSVTTAAVSVTQTFAVVCRIKGAMPAAVLNDTIGTSTNTVNTNKVF